MDNLDKLKTQLNLTKAETPEIQQKCFHDVKTLKNRMHAVKLVLGAHNPDQLPVPPPAASAVAPGGSNPGTGEATIGGGTVPEKAMDSADAAEVAPASEWWEAEPLYIAWLEAEAAKTVTEEAAKT